jgi:outer membrane protein
MKNLKSLLLATLMIALPMTATFAQSKIAHIDTQKLISEMPEVIAAQKQIQALEKTYANDIENSIKEYTAKAQAYEAEARNQTDIVNQARQNEMQSMQQNIQTYRETATQDLQKKQTEMMRPLYEKVAAAQGFEYVLDASAGGGVLVSKGKDLEAEVKVELGF